MQLGCCNHRWQLLNILLVQVLVERIFLYRQFHYLIKIDVFGERIIAKFLQVVVLIYLVLCLVRLYS